MFRMDEEDESKAGNPAPAIVEKALFDSRTILLTGGVDDKLAQRVGVNCSLGLPPMA